MKKFWLTISIIIISNTFLVAQTKVISKIIIWKNNIEIKNLKAKTLTVPSFINEVYNPEGIPFYNEIINLNNINLNSESIDLLMTNISYEEQKNLTDILLNTSFIEDEIKITYKINKSKNVYFLEYSFYPFIKKNGKILKVKSFDLNISKSKKGGNTIGNQKYTDNSVLSTGKWYKIAIPQTGVYKLTYSELTQIGFTNPSLVRVFGNDECILPEYNNELVADDLVENYIYKGADYILFYAKGPNKWQYNTSDNFFNRQTNIYSDTSYYFLTDKNTGFSNSTPISPTPSNSPTATITTFTYYDTFEKQLTNLIHSGQIWLGKSFLYEQEQTFDFEILNPVISSTAKLKIALAVRSPLYSSFDIKYAGNSKTEYFDAYFSETYYQYVDYKTLLYSFTENSTTLSVNLNFNKPTSSADAWLDYITINAKEYLKFREQLSFRSTENISINAVSKFEITNANSNVIVWDVTNPTRPLKINSNLSANTLYYNTITDTIKEFIAFTASQCPSPILDGEKLGIVTNQNIHNVSSSTDMLIICHKKFLSQALQIKQIHQDHDNLNVVVITTDQIYNEFSSGSKDVSAIRNYIKMVYSKTANNLKYVFLLGDGSFDNFDPTTELNPNYIPTYQTQSSFNINEMSTTSDDFFGLLDNNEGALNGYLDLAIGRFPAKNSQEADVFVAKLKNYYSPQSFGDWQNIITLVTDDRDKGSDAFTNDAEFLADKIDSTVQFLNIKKIYLDAFQQQSSANGQEYPDAVNELNNRINSGTLIVNYLGHGSEVALTSERLVTIHEVENWSNGNKLPLFITGTCEFSRFDDTKADIDATSAGEMVILNPNGGAIGMLTTARVSFSGTNLYMNAAFYSYLFSKQGNYYYTIGDAYYMAKNTMSSTNKLFFVLLGDPAVRLNYPKNKIEITKINNNDVASFDDTLKALEKVNIQGIVKNQSDILYSNFNGELNLTYFDKKKDFNTLNNDGNGSMPFWSQYNQLFRGRAKITNGTFNIEFIIPKDIYYYYGKSKFSFFAQSDNDQATGVFKDAFLGGINNNATEDNTGPTIKLFMNDSSFVNGDITDENPSIYAILFDENGINVSSASIGHDITAIIDNDNNKTFSLNEYYNSNINTYKQGVVEYELYKLVAGAHSVKLKVWDIYNNSSEKSINFIVAENNNLIISHLLNYPNPFTTNTDFYFEHNQAGIDLEILLQIFTVSGKVVKTIHTTMNTSGYRSEPINWNGLDDFGNPIGRGVYIYSLKIRTPDAKIVQAFEKLLILK